VVPCRSPKTRTLHGLCAEHDTLRWIIIHRPGCRIIQPLPHAYASRHSQLKVGKSLEAAATGIFYEHPRSPSRWLTYRVVNDQSQAKSTPDRLDITTKQRLGVLLYPLASQRQAYAVHTHTSAVMQSTLPNEPNVRLSPTAGRLSLSCWGPETLALHLMIDKTQ
jgi:hypothetical protein